MGYYSIAVGKVHCNDKNTYYTNLVHKYPCHDKHHEHTKYLKIAPTKSRSLADVVGFVVILVKSVLNHKMAVFLCNMYCLTVGLFFITKRGDTTNNILLISIYDIGRINL